MILPDKESADLIGKLLTAGIGFIEGKMPQLGAHLRKCVVRSGNSFLYTDDADKDLQIKGGKPLDPSPFNLLFILLTEAKNKTQSAPINPELLKNILAIGKKVS